MFLHTIHPNMAEDKPPALILQHPRSPVLFDPREPGDGHVHPIPVASLVDALVVAARERQAAGVDASDPLNRRAAIETLVEMVQTFSVDDVSRWLRNIAASIGQEL